MLTLIIPKLPMRNKAVTKKYYTEQLGFTDIGTADFAEYLIMSKDNLEIHFFLFETLDPRENYGQVYLRTENIEGFYQDLLDRKVSIHPAGPLQTKPWGQREFALLDPDNNLLSFGEAVG